MRVSPYFWYLFWNYLKDLLRRRESSKNIKFYVANPICFFILFYLSRSSDTTRLWRWFLMFQFFSVITFLPKTPLSPLLHKNWVQCVRSSSFLFWLLINSIIFLKLTSFYYILVCQMFIPNRRVAVNFIYTYTLLWLRLWAFFTIVVHKLIQYNTGIYFSRRLILSIEFTQFRSQLYAVVFLDPPILIDN